MKERTILLGVIALVVIFADQASSTAAVSAGNSCRRNVPVFTTDAAPSDGTLLFMTQLAGDSPRRDAAIQRVWYVGAGQQINNDMVPNVPAPRWARLWWQPDDDFAWYLLPSQYWHGDDTSADLYGVSCKPAVQPSYHTSFSSAIPEEQLPYKACSTTPTLIYPPDGAMLDTLIPLFEWDHSHEPGATELRLQVAKDPDFVHKVWTLGDSWLDSREWRDNRNFEASTTYYWLVYFACRKTEDPPFEVRSFTTGSGGIILSAPNPIAPSDASIVSSGAVRLQWEAVDGAVEYLVEWRESGRASYSFQWTNDTQYQIDYGLRPDTTYTWSIAARNNYAIGESATRRFTTSPSDTAALTNTSTLTSPSTLTPTLTLTPRPVAVVSVTTLNLRAGPGTQHRIVDRLHQGDALTVIGKNNEAADWLQVVTADEIEGWVASRFVIVYAGDVSIVPTPTPPPTQPTLPSPKYSFESGTMGWIPQQDPENVPDTQAVTAVVQSSNQAKSGLASLEIAVNLIGGNHPTDSKGEAFVDMRYDLPNGVTTPAPHDLTGKTITCWVYASPGSAGDASSPNGFQIFVKDTDFRSEYGTWKDITPQREGTWFPITLTPSMQMPPGGYKDSDFNPTRIILLGVKIGAGGKSTDQMRYAGRVYVDACDW
jgi:uncharacterized protein YraI